LESADVVADGVFGADASVVEVGAEVDQASVLVAEQVPDDDQDGVNRPGVSGGFGWCLYPVGVRRFRAA
jgi:hypothetical protein